MSNIGARIKKRRQVLGMRQHELAARVGVDRSAVSNWERGRHLPLRYQGKIEEVLGIDLSAEEQRPRVPASIRDAIRREFADPADRERVLRAIEDALTARPGRGSGEVRDGDLRGGLGGGPSSAAGPDRDGEPLPEPI